MRFSRDPTMPTPQDVRTKRYNRQPETTSRDLFTFSLSLSLSLSSPPTPLEPLWRSAFVQGGQPTMSRGTARSRRSSRVSFSIAIRMISHARADSCLVARQSSRRWRWKALGRGRASRERREKITARRAVTKLRVPIGSAKRHARESTDSECATMRTGEEGARAQHYVPPTRLIPD